MSEDNIPRHLAMLSVLPVQTDTCDGFTIQEISEDAFGEYTQKHRGWWERAVCWANKQGVTIKNTSLRRATGKNTPDRNGKKPALWCVSRETWEQHKRVVGEWRP